MCVKCEDTCTECDLDPANCSVCTPTAFLFEDNSSCLLVCPDGYYAETANNTCLPCDPQCRACELSPTYCVGCLVEMFMFTPNSSCVVKCP